MLSIAISHLVLCPRNPAHLDETPCVHESEGIACADIQSDESNLCLGGLLFVPAIRCVFSVFSLFSLIGW
jgi:hypothetical protein